MADPLPRTSRAIESAATGERFVISPEPACTCEYGCPNCGLPTAMMGNCPAWNPCPVGRAPNPDCPLHADVAEEERT